MGQIVIGRAVTSGQRGAPPNVSFDLGELLKTRLLAVANSGGGKSWLLRRLSEEIFGKVPLLIIDPEGEFASLREKFDFVLVGKGGETPADPRSAAIVAQKLLELNASAVCDIYELKPHDRHRWVRLFLEALIEAPKSLWRPRAVIVDEAHVYAPERGQGESEASTAMIDLATRGRKRGLCAIWASQRLSKLSKNGTAELLNRLVGPTFEDLDLDRAADLLSIARSEREAFEKEMKVLEPGTFYAFGRAISKERVKVKVGTVKTTHPEMGSTGYAAEPPPAPEKIKALLPKLADLPKLAEEKAKTEAELRSEIRSLKAQLATRPTVEKQTEPKVIEKVVKIQAVDPKAAKAIHRVVSAIERAAGKFEKVLEFGKELRSLSKDLGSQLHHAVQASENLGKPAITKPIIRRTLPVPMARPAPVHQKAVEQDNGELTKPQFGLLRGMRELNQIGIDVVLRPQLAGWLGKKVSGSLLNDLGRLRTLGYVHYQDKDVLLTEEGLRHAPEAELTPTPEAIFDHVIHAVSGPQAEILKKCHEVFPEWISREDLAAALGKTMSGSFLNDLGRLRVSAMIEYGTGEYKKHVKLSAWTILAQEISA